MARWAEEFGGGEAALLYLQPGAAVPLEAALTREDGAWLWRPTAAELARAGYGRCELRYSAGGAVVRSAAYATFVAAGLGEGGGTPGTAGDLAVKETTISAGSTSASVTISEGEKVLSVAARDTSSGEVVMMDAKVDSTTVNLTIARSYENDIAVLVTVI